jgi:hypothetical protein
MKIKWDFIEQAFIACCEHVVKLKKTGLSDESTIRQMCTKYIYHQFYRPTQRKSQKEDYSANLSTWNNEASSAVLNPDSRWDNRLLQVNTQSGNLFTRKQEEVKQATKISAIYHQVRDDAICSRIQIVTQPGFSGQPLYQELLGYLSSSSSAVSAWKVMNPELGSKGPDSAVVYLNKSLDSPEVHDLVEKLLPGLSAHLEPLSPPPLGLEIVSPGIYGMDLPPKDVQVGKLGINPKDTGSAGMIVSAVLGRAATLIDGLLRSDQIEMGKFNSDRQKYMKEFFGNVIREDLGWTLV